MIEKILVYKFVIFGREFLKPLRCTRNCQFRYINNGNVGEAFLKEVFSLIGIPCTGNEYTKIFIFQLVDIFFQRWRGISQVPLYLIISISFIPEFLVRLLFHRM